MRHRPPIRLAVPDYPQMCHPGHAAPEPVHRPPPCPQYHRDMQHCSSPGNLPKAEVLPCRQAVPIPQAALWCAAGLSGGLPGGTQGKDGNEREAATGAATGRGAATNTVTAGTKTEAGEAGRRWYLFSGEHGTAQMLLAVVWLLAPMAGTGEAAASAATLEA